MTSEYLDQPLRSEDQALGPQHLRTLESLVAISCEVCDESGAERDDVLIVAALQWAIKIGRERLNQLQQLEIDGQ